MRIRDWSSDVCSSDLSTPRPPSPERARADDERRRCRGLSRGATGAGSRGSATVERSGGPAAVVRTGAPLKPNQAAELRSEERRVGKEWVRKGRNWGCPGNEKKKQMPKQNADHN